MTTAPPAQRLSAPRVSHVVIGLAAGMFTGLFFGERARVLEPVADGFVRLLQMAVLPYLFVSIVSNIGGLRREDLSRLGIRVALVLAGVWTIVLLTALLMPLTFPGSHSGAFFSTTLLEQPASLDLVDLYIPANPFFALANNIVPAVVVFSIIIGAALMGLPGKQALLDMLAVLSATISRAMRFVTRLTPLGIFAITATAAGTLRIDEANRLQIYLVAYALFGLLITAWTLPGLISALTPVPVREIFVAVREPLLTATIIGDLFIVLPALIEACKALVARHAPRSEDAQALPDVIVPIAYNFPHSGKLLSVSFVLFAGWFSGASIQVGEYPRLALLSVATLFGSVTATIPFLLDLFRIPSDTFQLFIASSVINSRVGTAVAGMHMVAIAILGACASAGALRWRAAAIARYLVITAILTIAVIGSTRLLASSILGQPAGMAEVLDAMRIERPVDSIIAPAPLVPAAAPAPGTRLQSIAAGKTLRVGYLSSSLPYAFTNGTQELVGLDVALMHRLAREIGATLIFVPIPRTALDQPDGVAALLASGACDIVIGGVVVTTQRAGAMQLSASYLSETLGFVVPDRDRRRFASWETIRSGPLTVAMPSVPYFLDLLHERAPGARVVPVTNAEDLFGANAIAADAFVMPAERGSAWALRYPQYAVVVPLPDAIKVPLAFALPRGEPDLLSLVNTWIELQRGNGTITALFDYWILGRVSPTRQPRWSIIHDVLHWAN